MVKCVLGNKSALYNSGCLQPLRSKPAAAHSDTDPDKVEKYCSICERTTAGVESAASSDCVCLGVGPIAPVLLLLLRAQPRLPLRLRLLNTRSGATEGRLTLTARGM